MVGRERDRLAHVGRPAIVALAGLCAACPEHPDWMKWYSAVALYSQYLKAAAKLGFAASDCIVVEDAAAGVKAGKASGARVIAFLTTMTRRDLEDARADWIVRNCADIAVSSDSSGLQLSLSLS